MTDMSENTVEQAPVPEIPEVPAAVEAATAVIHTPAGPVPKKRGRKPKVALAPPPPAPVEAKKPRKRRTVEARPSKGDRAIAAAISAAQVDRVKCIDELSKVMQVQYSKEGVLKALDWKISMLNGNPAHAPAPPVPSYLPQTQFQMAVPTVYPQPLPAYTPPSMRQPSIPIDPRAANGGAEGIIDDTENDDPDKFLRVGGVVGEGKWIG